jgi:hypothetical protein
MKRGANSTLLQLYCCFIIIVYVNANYSEARFGDKKAK